MPIQAIALTSFIDNNIYPEQYSVYFLSDRSTCYYLQRR